MSDSLFGSAEALRRNSRIVRNTKRLCKFFRVYGLARRLLGGVAFLLEEGDSGRCLVKLASLKNFMEVKCKCLVLQGAGLQVGV